MAISNCSLMSIITCTLRKNSLSILQIPKHGELVAKKKMQVWLSATRKAKLLRQVPVQKERGLFRRPTTWKNAGLQSERPFPLPATPTVLIRLGREGLFFYLIIFLAFGMLVFYPFILLAFGRSV